VHTDPWPAVHRPVRRGGHLPAYTGIDLAGRTRGWAVDVAGGARDPRPVPRLPARRGELGRRAPAASVEETAQRGLPTPSVAAGAEFLSTLAGGPRGRAGLVAPRGTGAPWRYRR